MVADRLEIYRLIFIVTLINGFGSHAKVVTQFYGHFVGENSAESVRSSAEFQRANAQFDVTKDYDEVERFFVASGPTKRDLVAAIPTNRGKNERRSFFDDNRKDSCVLGTAETYLSWWINTNGTLNIPDDMKGR